MKIQTLRKGTQSSNKNPENYPLHSSLTCFCPVPLWKGDKHDPLPRSFLGSARIQETRLPGEWEEKAIILCLKVWTRVFYSDYKFLLPAALFLSVYLAEERGSVFPPVTVLSPHSSSFWVPDWPHHPSTGWQTPCFGSSGDIRRTLPCELLWRKQMRCWGKPNRGRGEGIRVERYPCGGIRRL